jgi:hypothetical protein
VSTATAAGIRGPRNTRTRCAVSVSSPAAFAVLVRPGGKGRTAANSYDTASVLPVAGDDPVNETDPTGLATEASERSRVLAALDETIAFIRSQPLNQDLLRQGWTSEIVGRLCGWFEERRLRIEGGWTPTSSDPVNMGEWFDSEGISPYEDDVLQQGFQRAAKALAGQHP